VTVHWQEVIRVVNLATISATLGFALAVAWSLRGKPTFPPYLKIMGLSYLGFAVFSLIVTQYALAEGIPVTWRTWVGSFAGALGVASTLWTWFSTRGSRGD
jgi:hypothetical protein